MLFLYTKKTYSSEQIDNSSEEIQIRPIQQVIRQNKS